MLVSRKIILSGSQVELYEYESAVVYEFVGTLMTASRTPDVSVNLRRLISCNLGRWRDASSRSYKPIFLTLTFKEQDISTSDARRLLKLFFLKMHKVRAVVDNELNRYIYVQERQKRGTIHFHILFFNLPYINNIYDKINEIWPYGHMIVKVVNERNGGYGRVADYMSKYLSKDRYVELQASYGVSRGLLRPVVLVEPDVVSMFYDKFLRGAEVSYAFSYKSRVNGEISYFRFDDLQYDSFYDDIYGLYEVQGYPQLTDSFGLV